MESLEKAEKDHLDAKRESAGEMGSALDLVKNMRQQAADAAKNDGFSNFMDQVKVAAPKLIDFNKAAQGFADAIGKTGVTAIELLTDPSKMVASALGKTEQGFYDLLKPLGVTPKNLQAWAEKLTATMTPAEMLAQAGTKMVDTITYMSGAFGTDLAYGVNSAAQGFLDIMAPLGYTTEKILEMGAAAEAEANFKEGLIGGSMSAWDQVAKQMADQYINKGANPFEVYRKMMEERNKKLKEVTEHFDSLQAAADKTSSSMQDLAPSMETIAKGMPKALETAVGKFNTATESIADFFGMGEDSPPMEPEKDYTTTLTNSESLLGTIASGISGLAFPVASIF
jgi:methyl-accepting chemotaxis protein